MIFLFLSKTQGQIPTNQSYVTKYSFQVLLGVFTGLTTFAIEPCFQAALIYNEASGRSAIQRCESAQWNSSIADTVQAALALEVVLDDYNQPSNDDQILQELNTNCSSGDCSWPPISTLGFCSACANITSSISMSCRSDNTSFLGHSCNYTLPNGLMIRDDPRPSYSWFNTTVDDNPTSYSYYQHWDNSFIASLSILRFNVCEQYGKYGPDGQPVPTPSASSLVDPIPLALECIFYWCIIGYNTSVNDGVLYQNITGTWHGGTIVNNSESSELNMSPPRDQWVDLGITQQTNFTAPTLVTDYVSGAIYMAFATPDDNMTFPPMSPLSNTDFKNYPSLFNYSTSEMTNAFRTGCDDLVFGTANNLGLVTTVRWGWFALPVVAVSLTTVFLIWVAASDQTDVWKNSPLALLFYGLTDKDRQDRLLVGVAETLSIDKMEEVAKNVQICLEKEGLRVPDQKLADQDAVDRGQKKVEHDQRFLNNRIRSSSWPQVLKPTAIL